MNTAGSPTTRWPQYLEEMVNSPNPPKSPATRLVNKVASNGEAEAVETKTE